MRSLARSTADVPRPAPNFLSFRSSSLPPVTCRTRSAVELPFKLFESFLRPLRPLLFSGRFSVTRFRLPRISMSQAEAQTPSLVVPEGYSLHTENTSHILLPNDNGAFLNPVQEFNRDMSVACIRTWGDQMNETKRKKWEESRERKALKRANKVKRQKS